MTFLEAVLASGRPFLSSPPCSSYLSRFALAFALPSARTSVRLLTTSARPEIEDPGLPRSSPLDRFRSRRGLCVTDITATEWCEKKVEFTLLYGNPKPTEAMEAGYNRHSQLQKEEKEVTGEVELHIKSMSAEDIWAIRMIKFIAGANKLLSEGSTRELQVVGVIEGIWMVGVIDEVRMPRDGDNVRPLLMDLKTRSTATIPSEAQKRNARLQLMCYKYLWDNLVTNNFPADQFFHHFGLNRRYTLSEGVKKYIHSFGFNVKTLEDVFTHFQGTCSLLPSSHEDLLLRYELQSDQSPLKNGDFSYDPGWFHKQISKCLEFWLGDRQAGFVPDNEKWKCYRCRFASICPRPSTTAGDGAST